MLNFLCKYIKHHHQGEVILAPEPKGGAKGDEVELGGASLILRGDNKEFTVVINQVSYTPVD